MNKIINSKDITIGADPEFFIVYNKVFCMPPAGVEDSILKVLRVVMRDDDPEVVKHAYYFDSKDLKIMSDGPTLELTVKPEKINNRDKLFIRIDQGYKIAKKLIEGHPYEISVVPTVNFDTVLFNPEKIDKKFAQACIFGCDPDIDAFDTDFIATTFSVKDYPFRHAGGHIHFGISNREVLNEIKAFSGYVVRFLAFTIGSYFLEMSPQKDGDKVRLSYYGKPGKFRVQKHGLEFRSPSNAWTTDKNILLSDEFEKLSLIGLNLVYQDNADEILNKFTNPFLEAFNNLDIGTLSQIREDVVKMTGE